MKNFLLYVTIHSKEGYVMKKFFKYFGITVLSLLVCLYILFLIVPVFLLGIANSYTGQISKMIEDSCGFKVKIENIKILTTPKLTAGLYAGHIEAAMPDGEQFLMADNVQGKISLLPLILRKIEIDMAGADNVNLNLKIKKDGKFLLEDFVPEANEKETPQNQAMTELPFGFKLSNHLPDIKVNNYNISFIDGVTDKSYSISGERFSIKDFILDKKIKLYAAGQVMLDDRVQFNYDVNLFNKVMPDLDLNDMVFSSSAKPESSNQSAAINIIDVFKNIYQNQFSANIIADLKTTGSFDDIHINGTANVSDMGLAVKGKKLPSSNVDINFKGNKIDFYSKLFTGETEITEFTGNVKTGKSPKIDLNCKSNAQFNSILRIVDSIAESFGYKDLNTLSATGSVDADFTIKSNLKKIESSGYLRVNPSSFAYKLYNISVNDIIADIDLSNNIVDIKDAHLSILGHPLKISGTLTPEAVADIKIAADKLSIKGLMLALGQVQLLKDNDVKSGVISVNALLKGRLDKIVPTVNLTVDNLNIKNIPSDTSVKLVSSTIDLSTDGKKTDGSVKASNASIINPIATLSMPQAQITFGDKDIVIDKADVYLNNSKIAVTGKVTDYMANSIKFDINANGNILASDIKSMIPADFRKDVVAKGSLPLSVSVAGNADSQDIKFSLDANQSNYVSILNVSQLNGKSTTIKGNVKLSGDTLKLSDTGIFANNEGLLYVKGSVSDLYKTQKLNLNISLPSKISMEIPGFKKSKLDAFGNINLSGTALNPHLNGNIEIPVIELPDMLLSLNDMSVSLNGPIVKGDGTLMKFVSGGITAENLAADFNLSNNVFYLKNITGDAFDGKVSGNVSYNIANGFIGVNFTGSDMDAQKAIAGAAGLKNALSGRLGFDADVTLHGATDVEMMKNLKGKANFEIKDGILGNIGRFENFLFAQNLQSNSIIKAAVNSVASLPTIKNTAEFKSISGNLTFNNGWAKLNPIKTSGPSMAYYITGQYNLLNATANVVVLGRISADVVSLLGPLGDLSVTKLTSYIPKFGALTGNLINALTSDPKNENVSSIPQLSSGNTNYKDFKVVFNGGVESKSSVKSFKWLSKCDTSALEQPTVKEQVEQTTQAVKNAVQQKIDDLNARREAQKQSAQEANQQLKDTVQGLKNLFKKDSSAAPADTTTVN